MVLDLVQLDMTSLEVLEEVDLVELVIHNTIQEVVELVEQRHLMLDKVEMVDRLEREDIPVLADVLAMLALQVLVAQRDRAINMVRVAHQGPQESLVARVVKWDYDTAMPVMDTTAQLDTLAA